VIEKGGVNTSVVFGKLGELAKTQLKVDHEDFFACGLSLVIHPKSLFLFTRQSLQNIKTKRTRKSKKNGKKSEEVAM